MPNYDPDYTETGLRLINTGNIPNDSGADRIQQAVEKINANTFLLEERSARLAQLDEELAQLLTGSPIFDGTTTTNSLVVQAKASLKGEILCSGALKVSNNAAFDSDVTFNRVVYSNGLLLVQDPDEKDNSSVAANTRWVRAELSRTLEALEGLTLDDLEDYAQLSGAVFKGPLKAPTLPADAASSDDVATLAYAQRYVTAQLKNYAPLANAQLNAAKVVTPEPEANDDLVVNAFWVNERLDTAVATLSDQLTSVGSSITAFQEDLLEISDQADAAASAALLGSIVIAARNDAEAGWLEADGSAVSETLHPLFYSLVGHNYDDPGNLPPAGMFALPDWSAEVDRLRTLNSVATAAPLKAFVYVGLPN